MKTKQSSHGSALRQGFTLLELMVSMSVTVILLGVVTYLTSMSTDTYRESRDEVRSARQAKDALDAISRDFETMVARMNNNYMWLYAGEDSLMDDEKQVVAGFEGPTGKEFTNSCQLIFFTGAADRYDGVIGGTGDSGGDVSAVSYRLIYRDQISDLNPDEVNAHPVFSLYRRIVNPDETFSGKKRANGEHDPSRALLGVTDLRTVWLSGLATGDPPPYVIGDLKGENVLVENIYEFSVTFLIKVTLFDDDVVPEDQLPYVLRVTINNGGVDELSISGNGISWLGSLKLPENKTMLPTATSNVDFTSGDLNGFSINPNVVNDGQLVGVEVGITVLSDRGLVLAQKSGLSRGDIIKEHGHHYTMTINTPRF